MTAGLSGKYPHMSLFSLLGGSNGRDRKTSAPVYSGPDPATNFANHIARFDALNAQREAREKAARKAAEDAAKYTGIELGEIEAWRVWKVVSGRLMSMAYKTVWIPGEPIYGKPHAYDHSGVHAFKTAQEACEQYDVSKAGTVAYKTLPGGINRYKVEHPIMAVGKIMLWGEIIEFEKGYRAENGQVLELKEIFPTTETDLLAELKTLYDLKEMHDETPP